MGSITWRWVSAPSPIFDVDTFKCVLLTSCLAAATTVANEPLTGDFDGILGLGLQSNSVIGSLIPPVYNNAPDGATFSANLFGITPTSQAPANHFLGLVLARPGSDRLPSLFGIGRHPDIVMDTAGGETLDPSTVQYGQVVSDMNGEFLWKTYVRAITVYVDGQAKPLALPAGTKGTSFPVAVLDTGVPLILTTSAIANGIYGALGIGPGSDGQCAFLLLSCTMFMKLMEVLDYVPCATPLNMTITLDGRGPIPLHPLDLTTEPAGQTTGQSCVGLIQADDAGLNSVTAAVDIILGVPFMRNAYTVLAYDVPLANGSFPNDMNSDTGSDPAHMRIGLLGLTNITTALSEFNTVRVLNQPLPSTGRGGQGGQGGSSGGGSEATVGGHKISVGIAVLIGLASFIGLCAALFGLRWFLTRRKWARVARTEGSQEGEGDGKDAYALTVRASGHEYDPSEGTLRTTNSNDSKLAYKDRVPSNLTTSTSGTQVEDGVDASGEFGQRVPRPRNEQRDSHNVNDPWDPRNYSMAFRDSIYESDDRPNAARSPSPPLDALDPPVLRPDHQRTTSELRDRAQSLTMPLLAHTRSESRTDDLTSLRLGSMMGVGTAVRGSKIDADFRQSVSSAQSARPRSISPVGTLRNSLTSPVDWTFEESLAPPSLRPPLEEAGES